MLATRWLPKHLLAFHGMLFPGLQKHWHSQKEKVMGMSTLLKEKYRFIVWSTQNGNGAQQGTVLKEMDE